MFGRLPAGSAVCLHAPTRLGASKGCCKERRNLLMQTHSPPAAAAACWLCSEAHHQKEGSVETTEIGAHGQGWQGAGLGDSSVSHCAVDVRER